MPSKWLRELKRGDVVRAELAGGGAYGDSLERDPEAVARDALQGKVSLDHARREYGVALDPRTMAVDREETARLRSGR